MFFYKIILCVYNLSHFLSHYWRWIFTQHLHYSAPVHLALSGGTDMIPWRTINTDWGRTTQIQSNSNRCVSSISMYVQGGGLFRFPKMIKFLDKWIHSMMAIVLIMNWKFSQQGLSSINNIFIILLLAFHCHQHCPFYHLSSHLIQVYLPEIINKMAIRFL